jgi:three-Cys-motif partner protein
MRDREAIEHLHSVLKDSEYRHLLNKRVQLINGEFVPEVPRIIEFIKNRGRAGRAIWVLDQFGYLDAPLTTIGEILQADNCSKVRFATRHGRYRCNETEAILASRPSQAAIASF